MAYDPKIFSYNALHNFVAKIENEDLLTILRIIETRNFEIIMQYLDNFSRLVSEFGEYPELKERIGAASENLKKSLLDAVNKLHPEHVFQIPEDKSRACSEFLEIFLKSNGGIFSTNYDLLLYWILMRNKTVEHCDGFGRELENQGEFASKEEQVWSELTWGKNKENQNVFYLHGALPFFDGGISVVKEQYNSRNYLMKNIGNRMNNGEYPIFVTAGNGEQKLNHIKHNEYLAFCYDSLCNIEGSLVSYGFSFGSYDEHIIDAINKAAKPGKKSPNRLLSIYVGVYSKSDIDRIEQIKNKFKCKLHIWDAKTIDVWKK